MKSLVTAALGRLSFSRSLFVAPASIALLVVGATTLVACTGAYSVDTAVDGVEAGSSCGCGDDSGNTSGDLSGSGSGSGDMEPGGSGGGVGSICASDSDCLSGETECTISKCLNGVCAATFAALNTPVSTQLTGDCRVSVCGALGEVVSIVDDKDVPSSTEVCQALACTNGVVTAAPALAGTLCAGGLCDAKGACVECLHDSDCVAGLCGINGQCLLPQCADGIKNGSECDLDCGGSDCAPCLTGKACLQGADCTLGVCIIAPGAQIGVCL